MTETCKCEHPRYDHYNGKCYGWMEGDPPCKCKRYREKKT